MVVNDDQGCLKGRGAPATIASRLAPTGVCVRLKEINPRKPLSRQIMSSGYINILK